MKGQGGMPPNGKSSTTLKQQYNGVMINDPNRPASAQVKQTRPFVSHLFKINLNHFSIYRQGELARAEKEIINEQIRSSHGE